MLQRLCLYSVLGIVLWTLEQDIQSTGFWMILALFWASETMTRRETESQMAVEYRAIQEFKLKHSELFTDKDKHND